MSKVFLNYVARERERLEALIAAAESRPQPDPLEITRLKKLRLAVHDQFADLQLRSDHHVSFGQP